MIELLAKSDPPETLVEHTENCLSVYFSMREMMPFLAEISGELDFFDHLLCELDFFDHLFIRLPFTISVRQQPDFRHNSNRLPSGGAFVTKFYRQDLWLGWIYHPQTSEPSAWRF